MKLDSGGLDDASNQCRRRAQGLWEGSYRPWIALAVTKQMQMRAEYIVPVLQEESVCVGYLPLFVSHSGDKLAFLKGLDLLHMLMKKFAQVSVVKPLVLSDLHDSNTSDL
jgi:hypothetical protein